MPETEPAGFRERQLPNSVRRMLGKPCALLAWARDHFRVSFSALNAVGRVRGEQDALKDWT
jgi:hypothetical protein